MCGIAAFSIPEGVNVNARLLAHNLLTQIETRGTHASGFAWYDADGGFGYYKQPKPGSQLSLAELPRNARTVILHTRYATQGDRRDNRNNHPVISTDNSVALVHNGVISNDYRLRTGLGITKEEHGEVDSLVIPSIIAQQGVGELSQLSGYAAIAWLDNRYEGKLMIARLKSSPVAFTHLPNGAFVMASTGALLEMALLYSGLEYGGIFNLPEGSMIAVDGGFITEHEAAPKMSYDYQSYQRYSGATAGGHGTTRTRTSPAVSRATGKGSEDATPPPVRVITPPKSEEQGESCSTDLEIYKQDLEKWQEKQAERDMKAEHPMVMFEPTEDDDWDYSDLKNEETPSDEEQFETIVARLEAEEAVAAFKDEGFYIVDHEGGMSHYPTLDDLEAQLRWTAKMGRTEYDLFPGADDNINWVNHIMDLGSVQSGGVLESWVEDRADIDNYESAAVRNLQYIREGAGYLGQLKGA